MSYLWHFASFNNESFNKIIGSGSADAEQLIIDAVTWDEWHNDMSVVTQLAAHLVACGADYSELNEDNAEILDEIVKMLFSPEGLEEQFGLEYESPDGIHYTTIAELIERNGGEENSPCLKLLKKGRRLDGSKCIGDYLILEPKEIQALLEEAQKAFNANINWSDEAHKTIAKECLIDVLNKIKEKGKYLVGIQG
jgi:hypothetical protein